MHTALLQILQHITPLDEEEKLLIQQCFIPKHLTKGSFFLNAGAVNKHIGFITKGLMRYFVYKNEVEATFIFSKETDFIADYQSFNSKLPSIQNIQAIEDCELLVIDFDSLQRIFTTTRNGNLLGRIVIEQRFDIMVAQLLSIYLHNPEERYKHFIATYADLAQRIPQYMIASYVGVQPESLSRIRRRLAQHIS